jgi:restriction system protein
MPVNHKKNRKAEFVKWFGPLLDALRDLGESGKPREVSNRIAKNLHLKGDILDATLKTGGNRFHNQVAWARQYLAWEGLLDASKHGTWKLTEKGRTTSLDEKQAHRIFLKWVKINQDNRKLQSSSLDSTFTEKIDDVSLEGLNDKDQPNLLEVLKNLSPSGFEKIIRELLRESGFANVEVTGGSADGGIDGYGTLEINPFVSFKVLFQCKRYKDGKSVSRSQLGDFRNAVMGRAEKGIFITTASFTSAAIQEACRDGVLQIELVDGVKLVEMFERVELGLTKRYTYDVDYSYFEKFK